MKKKEEWKDVIGFEEDYQISNFGCLKSKGRSIYHNRGFYIQLKESIVKPSNNKAGYCQFSLSDKFGKTHCVKIHRLVALHFIENSNNLEFVNHIDNDKSNNYYYNLEWVSHSENCTHRSKFMNVSSQYYGVCFDNVRKKWISQIRFNKKRIFLGRYVNEIDAYNRVLDFQKDNNIINKYS